MPVSGSQEWHKEQVSKFHVELGNLKELAQKLGEVLNEIKRRSDPTAFVQVRSKSLASFSEKALRKRNKYNRPLEQLTDLVGGRIITYTQAAANAVRRCIERLDHEAFFVDWDNSLDTAERLRPEEFGYKAMHYVVQLRTQALGIQFEERLRKFKVEIQVCTMLQYVWAAIGHDRLYKTQLAVSDRLKRRLSSIAAMLETAQDAFDDGIVTLDRYIDEFLPHMSADARQEEEMIWQSVIDVESSDPHAHLRLGDHFSSIGQWRIAYDHLATCLADENRPCPPGTEAKLGRAAARIGRLDIAREQFERAAERDKADWSVRCDLAELLEECGESAEALGRYREAFEFGAREPRVLVGYVTALVRQEGNMSCTRALGGALDAAIEECKRRAQLLVDLPSAFMQAGRCYLLRGDVYAALDAYCKGSITCESVDQIEAEEAGIGMMLESLRDGDLGQQDSLPFECANRLLKLLVIVVNRRLTVSTPTDGKADVGDRDNALDNKQLEELGTSDEDRLSLAEPVVIVAGGCDRNVEDRIKKYGPTIHEAFQHFEGTIICGGTTAGISGVVGDISRASEGAIRCIGYLPRELPDGDILHESYEIRAVNAGERQYSPIGPIQTWADLLLDHIAPTRVRLLGINGGNLSGFEFRLAMAMGATVGLIEESGRAASTLLIDPDWKQLGRITALFDEAVTIAPFVSLYSSAFQAVANAAERTEKLEKMARAQHDAYRHDKQTSAGYVHESMLPWDKGLDERYKESNRQQVAYSDTILRTEGFAIVSAQNPQPPEGFDFASASSKLTPVNFNDPEFVEPDGTGYDALWRMAQKEHGRFNAERLADDWQYGPERDLKAKTSPYLLPWNRLPTNVQEWDRDPFRKLHDFLKPLGLMIVCVVPKEMQT